MPRVWKIAPNKKQFQAHQSVKNNLVNTMVPSPYFDTASKHYSLGDCKNRPNAFRIAAPPHTEHINNYIAIVWTDLGQMGLEIIENKLSDWPELCSIWPWRAYIIWRIMITQTTRISWARRRARADDIRSPSHARSQIARKLGNPIENRIYHQIQHLGLYKIH